jgi:hypothetical protein
MQAEVLLESLHSLTDLLNMALVVMYDDKGAKF